MPIVVRNMVFAHCKDDVKRIPGSHDRPWVRLDLGENQLEQEIGKDHLDRHIVADPPLNTPIKVFQQRWSDQTFVVHRGYS